MTLCIRPGMVFERNIPTVRLFETLTFGLTRHDWLAQQASLQLDKVERDSQFVAVIDVLKQRWRASASKKGMILWKLVLQRVGEVGLRISLY